jgi:hypothetical protein
MKPQRRTVRWATGLIAGLLAALLAAGPARAASGDWLNVDCDIGWQGCYRSDTWVPVNLGILADIKEPFEGVLTVTGDQDEQTSMTIARRFVLTPKERLNLPLVARLSGGSSDCEVVIQDSSERTVWKQTYRAFDTGSGTRVRQPLNPSDILIGVVGRMDFGLRQVGQITHSEPIPAGSEGAASGAPVTSYPGGRRRYVNDSYNGRHGAVYVKDKLQASLPWDWTAYECLDLLILYDPDWAAMTPHQSAAIVQWVTGGGRLLVILGTHPLPVTQAIAKILPVTIGASRKITLPSRVVRDWNCEDVEAARAVTAWSLEDVKAWGWASEDYGTGDPLLAWGPVGFGKAGVLAFDPSPMHITAAVSPANFWIQQALPLLARHRLAPGAVKDNSDSGYNGYTPDDSSGAGVEVLNYLLDIPQMQPISIVWIILLLMGLAAVIGPIDYFVLKRFDRLPLTWLTFTFYIVAFSVVAYYGVRALRSGQAQVRTVSVVDAVSGQEGAWSSCYSGIFAPESDDYKLTGLGKGQWWSSFSPFSEEAQYYGERRTSRRMTCTQEDGSSIPSYLPINIWSMQCLLQESAAAEMPIAATVTRDGDTICATVENLSDAAVTRGWIEVAGGQVLRFGAIGPKAKITVTGRAGEDSASSSPPPPPTVYDNDGEPDAATPNLSVATKGSAQGPPAVLGACGARGTLKRTLAIEEAVARGAVLVCAQFDPPPAGFGLQDRDCRVTHVGLVRLVVVPEKGVRRD